MAIIHKKISKLAIVFGLILATFFLNPKGSYLSSLALCMPSYLAVTFGSYAFMRIGFKMSNIESHDEEKDSLLKDIERAHADLKKRGIVVKDNK